jgi:hypothetical protein
MVTGTADLDLREARAPEMASLATEPLTLGDVEIFKVNHELGWEAYRSVLPPALIPPNPPFVSWLFVRAPEGELGTFNLALMLIGCRAGSEARAFAFKAYVDGEQAGRVLRERFGIAADRANIRLHRQYDAVFATIEVDGRTALDVVARDPHILGTTDVTYSPIMVLARTQLGPRLLNIDVQTTIHQAERLKPQVNRFDRTSWGSADLRPSNPIAASMTAADLTLPRLRYVCDPRISALLGTEEIAGDGTAGKTAR